MLNRITRNTAFRAVALGAVVATAALGLAGCSGSTPPAGDDDTVGVSLIVKTNSNPFFIAMQEGAQAAAEDAGVSLTLAAGKEDGDEDTQVKAIEDAGLQRRAQRAHRGGRLAADLAGFTVARTFGARADMYSSKPPNTRS